MFHGKACYLGRHVENAGLGDLLLLGVFYTGASSAVQYSQRPPAFATEATISNSGRITLAFAAG